MTRLLDIILSLIALVVLLPFMLPVMILLKLTGEHYIFYGQRRVGRFGKKFTLLKFATMLKNSPNMGSGEVTVKDDPRVLPVGKFLRKTKINELPQLVNILAGDMSVVGPRPQTAKNLDYFPPEGKKIILSMRPGLTGIGSIVFRDEESVVARSGKSAEECYREVIGPYKAELEEWYSKRQNVGMYVLIIFVTAWVIVFPGSEIYRRVWPSLPPEPEFNHKETEKFLDNRM
jgi:lipopolysaccharide/colanic/teichoic acid biosynthesis glycosyltransferase